jgi:DNA-binding transcriptional MerR regulator
VSHDRRGEHVSIGEVLAQLRDEFPDVTISKIRFLESQGLIDPERTPSGYRKFYDTDIERLRWVLRQQKDHFLPLKVIKERLDELDASGEALPDTAVDSSPEPQGEEQNPALFEQERRQVARAEAVEVAAGVDDDEGTDELDMGGTGVSLTRRELATAADVDEGELAELEEYGLIRPAVVARDRVLFDEDALAVARVAAGFLRYGVEARHLRMYQAFAGREAGLFEQLLLPYRRQRNPEAREQARATLGELAGLGRRLRGALLQQAVRRSLGG